jgi:pimeloyl-ACP methyl ester carboxylesterase
MLLLPSLTFCKEKTDVVGSWLGTVSFQGVEIRIVFNIAEDSTTGEFTATMDSPDQGVTGIAIDRVSLEKRHLKMEVESAKGIYEGDISRDGDTIEGEWRQSGMTFPLNLTRTEGLPEIKRPQDPEPPFPYSDEDITYRNEADDVILAGTLTIPDSGGPFPAALLISGSGSQDRNEAIFGHKPFLVLADYLSRRGIAVLRVDDRGMGGSSKGPENATSEDFANDVLAGVEYLKNREEIDPARIGLIGHSEGGAIAPMVYGDSPDIAFIVMIAGPGLPGDQVLRRQSELMLRAEGYSDETIDIYRKMQEQAFAVIKEESNDSLILDKLNRIKEETIENLPDHVQGAPILTEDAIDVQIKLATAEWFKFFIAYDPRPALMEVKCPVLAINGEKDLQVASRENLEAIEKALKSGGNEDYTLMEMPGLNHMLQEAETGSVSEYGKIEQTISPDALELIANWIAERTRD